jgi:hypothetical protein
LIRPDHVRGRDHLYQAYCVDGALEDYLDDRDRELVDGGMDQETGMGADKVMAVGRVNGIEACDDVYANGNAIEIENRPYPYPPHDDDDDDGVDLHIPLHPPHSDKLLLDSFQVASTFLAESSKQ